MMRNSENNQLIDTFERTIRYLRISVTDRCNLRCRYCAPAAQHRIKRDQLLSLEEIHRLVEIGTRMGISKVRLTGGEPLVRKGIDTLISRLSRLSALKDISLTTNGTLLAQFSDKLRKRWIESAQHQSGYVGPKQVS